MKKLILSALAFFVFAAVALAQDVPAADVAGAYSFLKVVKDSSLTAEGGSGSVALNFNGWLGAVSDFALYHSSVIGPGLAAGTYAFGPRFSYRHWRRITPFTQVLFGGVRYADNGLSLRSAEAQTLHWTTRDDSRCGRKRNTLASGRTARRQTRCA